MLTAYFDDSGTDLKSDVAVVAGYLSSVANWESFAKSWQSLLNEYGINRMRRTDLEGFHGEFQSWNQDRTKQIAFIRKAHRIIHQFTYTGVGGAMIKADFNRVVPKEFARDYAGLYAWCAYSCVIDIGKWCDKHSYSGIVNYVFEAGTIGLGQVSAMLEAVHKDLALQQKHHIGTWSSGTKAILPLQAADTVAYEWFKFVDNVAVQDRKRKMRLSAADLFREDEEEYFGWADEKAFDVWVKSMQDVQV